jgi:hypothetical protein
MHSVRSRIYEYSRDIIVRPQARRWLAKLNSMALTKCPESSEI